MEILLKQIEDFLLPSAVLSSNKAQNTQLVPKHKLDELLYQVSLGDHIRSLQTVYRDSHDELNLAEELRCYGMSAANSDAPKLPTKSLTSKLCEGRSRVLALIKLCYGDNGVEYIRSLLDIANVYALQGLWEQVEEHISNAAKLIEKLTKDIKYKNANFIKVRSAQDAAARVSCTYATLRRHAVKYRGQVKHIR
jgi:hypothetical protein